MRWSKKKLAIAVFVVILLQPLAPVFASEISEETEVDTPQNAEQTTEDSDEPAIEKVESEPKEQEEDSTDKEEGEEQNIESEGENEGEDITETPVTMENEEENEENFVTENATSTETESDESEDDSEITATSSVSTHSTSTGTSSPENGEIASTTDQVGSSTSETTDTATTTTTAEETPQEEVEGVSTSTTSESAENENATSSQSEADITEREEEGDDPTLDEKTGTSTTENEGPNYAVATPVNVIFNDDNYHQFSKEQCVRVNDGSFYCTDTESEEPLSGSDRVYATTDSEDGDREIFVEYQGSITKITDNSFEDDAPYYDQISETIVWHRLIEGRYQIVEYSLLEKEERVLTHGSNNNMQPSRYGNLTVWQTWNGGDWDIVLSENSEHRLLTDNDEHDIAPKIHGTYVIWQALNDGTWTVKVYDRVTDTVEQIESSDGGSIENPRFVLVYDTKSENGDVETKGYDLDSKSVVPLSSTPAPVPADIPDSDQTGEDRALVSPTPSVKTKSGDEEDDETDIDTSTSTDPLDVVIVPYLEITEESTENSDDMAEDENPQDNLDIVVAPYQPDTTRDSQ